MIIAKKKVMAPDYIRLDKVGTRGGRTGLTFAR